MIFVAILLLLIAGLVTLVVGRLRRQRRLVKIGLFLLVAGLVAMGVALSFAHGVHTTVTTGVG